MYISFIFNTFAKYHNDNRNRFDLLWKNVANFSKKLVVGSVQYNIKQKKKQVGIKSGQFHTKIIKCVTSIMESVVENIL